MLARASTSRHRSRAEISIKASCPGLLNFVSREPWAVWVGFLVCCKQTRATKLLVVDKALNFHMIPLTAVLVVYSSTQYLCIYFKCLSDVES